MKRIVDNVDCPAVPVLTALKLRKCRNHNLNREGVTALAQRLEKYWRDRGYPAARFWPEPIHERFEKLGTHELYRVTCNLVNGLPPRVPG